MNIADMVEMVHVEKLTPRGYLPGDPVKALYRLWDREDLNSLVYNDLMNWFFIAVNTENTMTRLRLAVLTSWQCLDTRTEFIDFYTRLLPLVEASCCFLWGQSIVLRV